jgi:integrase
MISKKCVGNSVGNKTFGLKNKGVKMKRIKTKYPGVTYIIGQSVATGKAEKIFYIRYRRDGKLIEEKAGRQYQDDMTAARAFSKRAQRIEGKEPTNRERRQAEQEIKKREVSRWTVERLWKQYKKANPNLKGMATDENRFSKHLKRPFGKKEPKGILPLDVKRVELRLLKKLKPATVRNSLELLRRIVNFGVKNRLCAGLDFTIQMPEVNNTTTEDLTPAQLNRLLVVIEADKHPHAGAIMLTALYTGMRRGELFKLKWSDVDFRTGFIAIRDPKGGPDQRIPLNDAARDVLKRLPKIKKSDFVFFGRGGRQRTDINKAVNEIKRKARLPKSFRPLHGLRHVYASILASSGQVDMFTLQKLLTHKSPQMTQRYAHLRDDALKQAANVAVEVISKTREENEKDKVAQR